MVNPGKANYPLVKKTSLELAIDVEKEVLNYFYQIDNGEKPNGLRTNSELAMEYGLKVYGKPVTKKCISNILAKYIPVDLCELRETELKEESYFIVKFKTSEENSANGKNGADKTNYIIKLSKYLDMLIERQKIDSSNL
jgi:hypothetical protein